jgi:hypothetical protein
VDDYGSLIQSGMNLVPDLNKQLLERAQIGAYNAAAQENRVQAAAEAEKVRRQQQFMADLQASDGSATAVSHLIMKYPEFADHLKQGWDVGDKSATEADLTQMGELYSAAQGGRWDLVAQKVHARHDAEKAAGRADDAYSMILDVADKAAAGDEASQKLAKTMIGSAIAAKTGPEHFGTVYGALHGTPHVLGPGDVLVGPDNAVIAHSPLVQDKQGNLYDYNSVMGGGDPASPGAVPASGMTPAVASVASTLSSALPAPVVAGFLGNFHIEGGYTGAKGDGGSASGIAQWHDDRAAQFEKVIGKPVTEATPQEQARFVLWEMQNPEAAGMTVKQRDAILAAKTPAQAAALIDQYYERSDGSARKDRMQAATAFASDSAPPQQKSGPKLLLGSAPAAPEGFRWTDETHTKLEPIPGGPKDPTGSGGPAPQELEDAATQYLLTGQMPPLGMGSGGLKQQILAKRSEIMKRVGITAEQLPAFQAQYKADQTALQENGKLLSNLQASENALKANGQQVWNSHRVLVQDGIISDNPWMTRRKLDYYQQFGSPDQRAHVKTYLDAVNAYSTEYSKFMTAANGMGGSAAPSDSARQQAGELNDPGLAATPLLAHLRQGLTEAINKKNGVAEQNRQLQHKLSSYLHPHSESHEDGGWITLPSGLKVRKVK